MSPQDRHDPLNGARYLCIAVITVGLTLLGIGAIGVFCQYAIPPIPHGPEFDAQYTVLDGFFYAGQPAKTVAYQAGCLATPFLLGLGFFLARRWVEKLSGKTIDRLIWTGVVFNFLLVAACAWPMIYCPHPPLPFVPPSWLLLPFSFSHPFCTPARVLFLLMAGTVGAFFLATPPSRRNANWAMVLLLALWALLIPSRFYLPCEMTDMPRFTYHLNSVLDSLSQSVNGHHWLVDFSHIYGGYGEMLAPIIRLFPCEIGVLIAALVIPNVLGMLCLLLTARLIIRRPAILFICGLALLAVGYLSTSEDLNYGYNTVRVFFPSVGLLVATLYFRHSSAFWYAATTLVTSLASIWNLDTGLVLWASWLGTLLAMELAARNLPGMARHFLIQTLSLVAAWTAFFLYLRLVSGQWPDGGLLFYFQKLVFSSGYFCVPLISPDMWGCVLSLYIVGLAVVLCTYFRGNASWLTPVTLMISLLGIGVFSYFMGRSAESNLVGVAYPAVLLAGILWAEGEVQMQQGTLPKSARFFLLPLKVALFWWAFLWVAALPDLLAKSGHVARNWNSMEQTPLRANAAYVTQRVQPHENDVFFLSNDSGIYYYLSDTVRPINIPGMIELLRTQDMDVLVEAIRARRIGKLFVEQNFYGIEMYRPDIYQEVRDAVAQNYQVSEIGPTGSLILYTPR